MFSSTYDRRRQVGGSQHGRYYATERRRHRYSTFSIMKWFRRSKRFDGGDDDNDDDDSAWFRDDLKRIQQAYMEQDPDYAAVTPIVPRRRPASTWCRWSGSTTTVYSFAYVDGARRDGGGDGGGGGSDDDPVEYIDAATLPVAARRRTPECNDGGGRRSSSAFRKSPVADGKIATATMTATRRRNKRAAPPPPPPLLSPLPAVHAAGPSRSSVETVKTTTMQRRTATTSRKKYRAPQPPTVAPEPRPQQPPLQSRRGAPQRRKKGPAPKPPVVQQQQQQQQQQLPRKTAAVEPGPPEVFSNVRRKITQYERDRLMQRVDKIEKHFFEKNATAAALSTTAAADRGQKTTAATLGGGGGGTFGFASAAALYTAMAATNLTELDKRAAEICQRRKHGFDVIAEEHKNAIVAAVIRKSYPATVAATATKDTAAAAAKNTAAAAKDTAAAAKDTAAAATKDTAATKAAQPSTNRRQKPAAGETAADDEKQLVRHKRLAFYQQRAATAAHGKLQVDGDESKATGSSSAAVEKSSLGTQTTGSVVVAKTPKTATTAGTAVRSADSKNLPCEDSNCYQQLMAMEMQSDLVLHNGPFECTVCLCTYDNNGVVLRDCLHVFCRPCLQMTISHSKAEQVVCPYIDERYSCTGVLQHREIKKILDSEEEYERFLQRSVERARQLLAKERDGGSFQCRRPDCTGWCLIYDKNQVFEFKCPVCGTITCVRCGSIHRQGKKCKTIEENCSSDIDIPATLEDLIGRGDAMICPGCNTILSKQQGCDWIKCAVCFMEICWATKGPRWGPKGKGDTTGGCMCGIPPGRKCHSDCKYCH